MTKPFNIFPTKGYRNSQYQVITDLSNLKIEFIFEGKVEKEFYASKDQVQIVDELKNTGIYCVRCNHNGKTFEHEIHVRDAFRLGTSVFKRAFVFDDSNYSFFLMKDRLLLFDEAKKLVLTENELSPTRISQIDKNHFLFETRIGEGNNSITNLGIFSTETFSIVSELVNEYKVVNVSINSNRAWLYQISTQTLRCFEIRNGSGSYFELLISFEGAYYNHYDPEFNLVSIEHPEQFYFVHSSETERVIKLEKTNNNAIDHCGFHIKKEGSELHVENVLTGYSCTLESKAIINLNHVDYLHVGSNLLKDQTLSDYKEQVKQSKYQLTTDIPGDKTYYSSEFPESEIKREAVISQSLHPTIDGVFIFARTKSQEFKGINYYKEKGVWNPRPKTSLRVNYSLQFHNGNRVVSLIDSSNSATVIDAKKSVLIIKNDSKLSLYRGLQKRVFEDGFSFKFISVGTNEYVLASREKQYSLFDLENINAPILENIEIFNSNHLSEHKIVWYRGKQKYVSGKNYLNGFSLVLRREVFLGEKKARHSLFEDASTYEVSRDYILSSNKLLIDPNSGNIFDAVVGEIQTTSENLSKVVSRRAKQLYLSKFVPSKGKFELLSIDFNDLRYMESFLSPDGNMLVLKDSENRYSLYDVEKDECVRFLSGSFLQFSNEGNLILEEDDRRAVKIYDPVTSLDITPPNYHHYRFLSPDGKLYSQISMKTRFFNRATDREMSISEVSNLRKELDDHPLFYSLNPQVRKRYASLRETVERNRRKYFEQNRDECLQLKILVPEAISSYKLIRTEKYSEIGIVGTEVRTEIVFPDDLQFFNYAAFSYDNAYFGYVGKPGSNGLIHIYKLNFDEKEQTLSVGASFLSRRPRYASWVCGFSKNGFFATYDSAPDTYVIQANDNLFSQEIDEDELKENLLKSQSDLAHRYKNWSEIKGKNYLTFSPTGNYLALSEQGYEPLTLGGYGHQESNAVHIAETETSRVIDSFTAHGDKIKYDRTKKVTFVAFSENERRIMTLSTDGVVIVRNLKLPQASYVSSIRERTVTI